MVALTVVFLAVIAFGLVGAILGYSLGFDNGFDAAIECYEKELEDVQSNTDF